MLRVQAAAAVGPDRCLPSHSRLRVFVPAERTETRCADFWHSDYGFARSSNCTSRVMHLLALFQEVMGAVAVVDC
jgi:hypothetical protein